MFKFLATVLFILGIIAHFMLNVPADYVLTF